MKPPSRRRTIPSRFETKKVATANQKLSNGWTKQEQQNFACGLRQQKFHSELSLLELRKKVPKRSLLEIQSLIRSLKTQVVRRVRLQVQKQRRMEQRTKVPIEIWADIAQKMAGDYEETMSSAFSQMLVIAATEPCSLLHSNPPRSPDSPACAAKNICPIPIGPLLGKDVIAQSPGKDSSLNSSAETTMVASPHSQSSSVTGKESTVSSTPKSSAGPLPLHSDQLTQQAESGQAEQGSHSSSVEVDFEKIYQFMSKSNAKISNLPLTSMESAVLLDLLMSLPEELPQLDCMELQHHLLQVHTRLTTTAGAAVSFPNADHIPAVNTSVSTCMTTKRSDVSPQPQSINCSSRDTAVVEGDPNKGNSGAKTEQEKAAELTLASGSVSSQSSMMALQDKTDWAAAGLCPLNPFSVPVGLLKRQ